ncbi:MAG: SH3 domain-containing protein [Patescibacteria group bacterium]
MQFKHASLLLIVILLGTAVLTFIVIERQKELNDQRATALEDIGEPIDLPVSTQTPAQQIDPATLKANEYLSTSVDLNGDGVVEKISIEVKGSSAEGTSTILTASGSSIVFPGSNPEGFFGIVDINITDHEKEIAVSDLGPSGDPTTGFYRFDGSLLQLIGTTQGTYETIEFAGNGMLTTQTRASILQTWFYTDNFTLGSDHKLERVNQDLYLINPKATGAHLTMLQDLPLHTDASSKTSASVATTLKKGEAITFVGCDDVAWCEVKSATGIAGWFLVENYDTIVKVGGIRVPASEVFEGLSNAD